MESHRGLAGRLECPLHERAQVRHIVAGEVDAAIRLLQRGQRLERRRRFLTPRAAAPRHAWPRDGERRLELRCVLRVNARAVLERQALAFGGWTLAHLPVEVEEVADEHAFRSLEAVRRIKDLPDLLIRPGSAAVD